MNASINCTYLELKPGGGSGGSGSDGAINCTYLELKLGSRAGYTGLFAYQLYLSGIETYIHLTLLSHKHHYQLYLSGIETPLRWPDTHGWRSYQLYLSGIETNYSWPWRVAVNAINCTYLELKPLCVGDHNRLQFSYQLYLSGIETYYQRMHRLEILLLSIVPIWNWNSIPHHNHIPHSHLSIVPIWNWNTAPVIIRFPSTSLSIVPIWNWNEVRGFLKRRRSQLSIVPIWNWNLHKETVEMAKCWAINCTYLELKLECLPFLKGSEWNYQLYLSGIETGYVKICGFEISLSIVPIWNWNLQIQCRTLRIFLLSIVPIWNWN